MLTIHSRGESETIEIARRLGASLKGGEVLALTGTLGAGKTVFVKGLAQGLDIKDVITSPTFVIVKTYHGRLPLHHVDFYRLERIDDLATIGFEDLFEENTVVAIEWAEKFSSALPDSFLQISIFYVGERSRRFQFQATGNPQWENQLAQIFAPYGVIRETQSPKFKP